ncbi:hypothetical protein QBZ16_002482 [Prototheca wickerhamii]|uniref:phosphoribosylaminoimidazole carboxylase n=1 Tax=Prototheca wickerhamii TaxID=3111 RepID=A0AAD9MP15_PROWI|nr:hypothetical protein QBZ16_002482 [Prototheca wickerhamii]
MLPLVTSPHAAPPSASEDALLEVLQNVATGLISASDGAVQLQGITGSSHGKTPDKILASLCHIAARQGSAAATRVSRGVAEAVLAQDTRVEHHPTAHMLTLKTGSSAKLPGTVALICAGTAKQQVVEECRLVLQAMGCYTFKLPESGVMGIHRIVRNLEAVQAADVVVCITGMDGGLASVVAGLVDIPVVALPTSAGYGTAFGGVTPLLAALNSAAPGVTVVNVDSGFGAAMAAWRVLVNTKRARDAVIKSIEAQGHAAFS